MASDGKYYKTDVFDLEGMFRIIESIPSKKAEPIKQKTWSGYTTKEYKSYKGLTKENLRDNMTNMELVLNMLAEVSFTEISKANEEKIKRMQESQLSKVEQ
jgi:hypothetical protein